MAPTVEIGVIAAQSDLDRARQTAVLTLTNGNTRPGLKVQVSLGNGQPPRVPFLLQALLGPRDFGFLYGGVPDFRPRPPGRCSHLVLLWDGQPTAASSASAPIPARDLKWTYAKGWLAEDGLMARTFDWRLACYDGKRKVKPGDLQRVCNWTPSRKQHGHSTLSAIMDINGSALGLYELYGGSRNVWPDARETHFYLQVKYNATWFVVKRIKPLNVVA